MSDEMQSIPEAGEQDQAEYGQEEALRWLQDPIAQAEYVKYLKQLERVQNETD